MGKNEFDAEQFTELDEKNFETSRGLKTNTVKDQKEHDTKIWGMIKSTDKQRTKRLHSEDFLSFSPNKAWVENQSL